MMPPSPNAATAAQLTLADAVSGTMPTESPDATNATNAFANFLSSTLMPSSRLPSEMTWLMAEIGMALNKLEDLMEGFARLCPPEYLPVPNSATEKINE